MSFLNSLDYVVANGSSLSLPVTGGAADGGEYTCVAANQAGSGSNTVTLLVRPEITQQPAPQFVNEGVDVTLTCEADSFPSPYYQWEMMNRETMSFEQLANETNNTLVLSSIGFDQYGRYRCVATANGIVENATSDSALVTVSPFGSVTASPDNQIQSINETANFTCSAEGGPNNMFRWIKGSNVPMRSSPLDVMSFLNGLDYVVANGSSLSLPVTGGAADGGEYTCVAANQAGSGSDTVTLLVRPEITQQPTPQFVTEGVDVTLSCRADSFPSPYYQWEMMNRETMLFEQLANETNNTLVLSSIGFDQYGRYRCVATANGIVENATSDSALVTVSPFSSVMASPDNQTRSINETANFTCSAQGGPYNMFRWIKGSSVPMQSSPPLDVMSFLNGLDYVVANGSSLSLPVTGGAADGGEYTCVVVNQAGFDNGTVTLFVSPRFIDQPDNQFVNPEDTVNLTCIADSFPAPEYQWQMMNRSSGVFEDLYGQTMSTLTITNIQYEQYGMYRCVVTTPVINEMITSDPALITVSVNGSVLIDPDFTIVNNGSDIAFNCSANGGPNNMFVWVRPDDLEYIAASSSILQNARARSTLPLSVTDILAELANITLQFGTSFTLSSINATENGGQYFCIVINEAGIDANSTTVFVRPVITEQPQSVLTDANETVTLSCQADSFPPPSYQWRYLNMNTGMFQYVIGANESTLTFPSINYEENGVYHCVARAFGIVENDTSNNAVITVSPLGSVFISPLVTNSFEYMMYTLTCNARGGPMNSFQWTYLRTNQIVSNTSVYQFTSSVETGGDYRCVVSNEAGDDTSNTTVNVGPVITVNPVSINVSIDTEDIVLSCEARGIPVPVIIWTHNGSENVLNDNGEDGTFANDVSVTVTSLGLGTIRSELVISSALANNTGEYACNATSPVSFYESVMSQIALVLVQAIPERPYNLSVSDLTSRNLTLSWVEPHDNNAPILGYYIFYNRPDFFGGEQVILESEGPMEQLFIEELHPGVFYDFQVIAFNEEGNSSISDPLRVLTLEEAPSGFPQSLSSMTINSTAIQVTWAVVLPSETNGNITGYTIFITTDVSFVTDFYQVINTDTILQYTFTGLQEYVNYTFTILASTAQGNGPQSPPVTSLTDEAIPDSPPQNFSVTSFSPNEISLSWTPPLIEDINGVIDYYIIRYRITEQLGVDNVDPTLNQVNVSGNLLMTNLTVLDNYTVYEISIRAVTIGEGPSTTLTQRTAENVPGAPPQNLIAVTNSTTSITITWSPPPLDMTFGIITGYEVQYGEYNVTDGTLMDGTDPIRQNTTNNETFELTLTDLQEAREYGFQVRAITVGPGPYTDIVTNTTFTAPPAVAPGDPRPPPLNETEPTPETTSTVTLSWDPIPADEANGDLTYRVDIVVLEQTNCTRSARKKRETNVITVTNTLELCLMAADITDVFNRSVPGNTTSLTLSVAPFTQYNFSVTGVTSAGSGPTSPLIPFGTPQGVPTAPQILRVVNGSATSLIIDWFRPLCDNGVRTGYMVYYRSLEPDGLQGSPVSPHRIDNASAETLTITGLTPNTTYEVTVCAMTTIGCGVNITGTNITTEAAPEEVTNFRSSLNSSLFLINLEWTPPSERNGSFLYEIVYSARQDFNYSDSPMCPNSRVQSVGPITLPPLSGSLNSFTIPNTLPFANYTIEIRAYNQLFGLELASDVVIETIQTEPIAANTSVISLFATAQNSTSILVSWDVPCVPNGDISFYRIGISGLPPQNSSMTSHIIVNLASNRIYDITVQPVTIFNGGELNGTVSDPISVNVTTVSPNVPAIATTGAISRGTSTLGVALPRPDLFEREFDNRRVIFYGVIVSDNITISNDDLGRQYPDPQPNPSQTYYYLAAAWNNASSVPNQFTVGAGGMTSATRNGNVQVYNNIGLRRETTYCIVVVVYLDSGVDREPLIRYAKVLVEETRLGYSRPVLGFFMTLIILLIIGAIVGVVLFFVYRRYKTSIRTGIYSLVKRNRGDTELDTLKRGPAGSVVISNPPVVTEKDQDSTWVNFSEKGTISVEDFPAHVANLHSNDDYLFSVEYPTVEPQHHPTKDATQHPDNAIKNRYANITAYDHSRVKLQEIPNVPGSDYINANYIDGYKKQNAYIASQGPVPHSIPDFWRMVWEQDTQTIVMLTNLEEKGRIKCHLYWPPAEKRVVVHGQIRIELQEELCLTDYTIRTFSLQHKVSSNERTVKQFHFTSWPDFGVPEHPTNLLRFVHKVARENPESAGPIVVHCSAGVGRTGTFVTISCQILQILDRQCVDIFNFVQAMRYRRCFMVQTEAQYIFIHDALLEYLECGETEVSAREVKEQYRRLGDIADKETGKSRLELEFDNIQNTIHTEPITYAGTLQCNRQKNRYANVIPFDKTRCKLSTVPGVEGTDYINGNFIEGYHKGKAFIATQGPLPDTTDDFWRMLWEHKCATVIMLANEREGSKVMCHKYWPVAGTEMYGYFEVSLYSVKEYPDYILREFKIVDSRDAEGSSQHVKQFQYVSWPSKGVPDSAAGLLDVREQVEKWQRNSGDKPIVVHCSGGCGRTGTYIAMCLLIDRLKTEGLVDVFQVVRALRLQRPGMVRSVDQYEFCYKAILEYLGSFDTYANFSL